MDQNKLSLRHLLGDKFHPLQPELILATEYEICAVGGMGAGKTYAACCAAIRHGAKYPGANILIARFTNDEMLKTTKKLFYEIVTHKGLESYFTKPRIWDYREGTNHARMTTGSEYTFSNLEAKIDKFKNVEYSLVVIDQLEEVQFEVYQLLLQRCRLSSVPAEGRHVISIANDEGDNWIRRRFLTYEPPHGVPPLKLQRKLIRGTSFENPHLDELARANLLALPPELQKRWAFATMEAGASRLIPDFRIIDPVTVPNHWPRWVGIDPARSTGVTCALMVTVNPDKDALGLIPPNAPHFYAEYWAEGRDAEVHADGINKLVGIHRPRAQVMDRSAWSAAVQTRRMGTLCVADLYVKAGLIVSPSQGDAWTRVMLFLNAQRRGLTVSKDCEHLIKQGPEYRIKGQVNSSGPLRIEKKQSFHAIDAGGYALAMIPTRVAPVDQRELREAFDIPEHVDDGSRKHWERVRRSLPKRLGESLVTLGEDELPDIGTEPVPWDSHRRLEDEDW